MTQCPPGDICNQAGRDVRFKGQVISIPSERMERTIIEVATSQNGFSPSKVQIMLPHTQYDLFYGDRVLLSGKLKSPEKNPEDNFSYPLYLAGKGIFSTMYNPELKKIKGLSESQTIKEIFYENIYYFREKIRRTVNQYLVEPQAAVMNAMVIGDQGMINSDLREEYGETGIVHILSVSGAHVTLVIAIIVYLVNLFVSRRAVILAAVLAGVIVYLLISGAPDCAIRAGIMGVLTFLAFQKGKLANIKTLFWLSGAVLLYFNPLDLASDVGFQLSYFAVSGMIYLFPLLDKVVYWGRTGLGWKILRVLSISLSISLPVSPLVLYYFGILSLVSPIANLVLLPFFSALLPLGFILVGMGLLGNYWGMMGILGSLAAYVIHNLFWLIQSITNLLLKIPGSHFSGSIKAGWLLIFYISLFLLTIALKYLVRNFIIPKRLKYFRSEEYLSPPYEGGEVYYLLRNKSKKIKTAIKVHIESFFEDKFSKVIFFSWLLVVGCLLLVSVNYLYGSSRPARLVMFHVGQGDAFLLDWPRYHFQILIDGGPGRRVLSELGEILPPYDRKIEMLMLSHPHQDHLEGLIGVLERYGVSFVILPSLPQKLVGPQHTVGGHAPSLLNILWQKIIADKIPIMISRRGQRISFAAGKEKITELEFLTPFFDYSSNKIQDMNNQSAVLKMNYPRKALFVGDSSSKAEKVLLTKESHNIKVEMLKIGHHGSRFSTSNEFLNAVQPQVALISVGKNNLFGHPAPATLKKLAAKGIKIYRTDLDGRVQIKLTN